jgi:hypothetical protein
MGKCVLFSGRGTGPLYMDEKGGAEEGEGNQGEEAEEEEEGDEEGGRDTTAIESTPLLSSLAIEEGEG